MIVYFFYQKSYNLTFLLKKGNGISTDKNKKK